MEAGKRHQDIANFMEAQRQGIATGKQMVWNPQTSKFEVVASGTAPDNLPKVTREDLQAFASYGR
jgi:hypothetical protein